MPCALSDPLEVAGLASLEYLELPVQEWRVVLDARAVPRTLSVAAIKVQRAPRPVVALAEEILALGDRTQVVQTVLEGNLGPAKS